MPDKWEKIQEFVNENNDLLIMIANPQTDEINISFNKRNAFVKFPTKEMKEGVVFNVLRSSVFEDAIDPFICGIMKATEIDEKNGAQLYKVLGGAIKGIGEETKRSSLKIVNKTTKRNAKSKKR